MISLEPVVRLARRHPQESRDLLKGKVVKQGSVVEDVVSLAAQAVPRELVAGDCQVTCPLVCNTGTDRFQRPGNLL